ncbi:polysaccharide deacetylase family protein [Legionella yabuuchiae]|uniref:polysaccharide deacetylase family protein n=1 Tax=Legionella yabuuchiae TaxID=376727 RepID=UPI001056E161|nr:polysaccharide deacetylase family protein [Legionella yabuuchiae]
MLRRYGFILLALSVFSTTSIAQVREIAITIDDLPFVGTTHNKPGNLNRERERFLSILQSLKEHNVPATGFVVAGTIEKDQWELLEEFKNAGLTIGNHTYSHINLNRSSAERYINDIAKADQVLAPLMTGPKYFRYPYLAEGKGETKEAVLNFLTENQYIVAPVTIDSKDFKFNAALLAIHWRNRDKHVNRIKNQYLNYIWRQTLRAEKKANGKPVKQILLIHANLLNSHVMGDIIQMYKDQGYKFITLTEALSNTDNTEPEVITPVAEVPEERSDV